jgi:D-alanyl-D-alanine dipeptidase
MPSVEAASAEQAHQVSVGQSSEPLVCLEGAVPWLSAYRELGIGHDRGAPWLRASVVERLQKARHDLPDGYDLIVLDGWRDMAFQSRLLNHYTALEMETDGYVSDPGNTRLVPPHVTGGAVDLTLTYGGLPLALGTDFDSFDSRAHFAAGADYHSDEVLGLRALLYTAMLASGFAPYPFEWWHWSYGDQWWAAFTGRTESLFDEAAPPPPIPD